VIQEQRVVGGVAGVGEHVIHAAAGANQVEPAFPVLLLPQEEKAFLSTDERPDKAQHHRGHIVRVAEGAAIARETHDLTVQLPVPVPLRLVCALGAHPQVPLAAQLPLGFPQTRLETFTLLP
jgi:hypothetical protein